MSEDSPISVTIMESEYRVACPPEEHDALLAAAENLNDTMLGIRNTGNVVGVERIAVMAALNISYELLNTQKQLAELETVTDERLQTLLNKADSALRRFKHHDDSI